MVLSTGYVLLIMADIYMNRYDTEMKAAFKSFCIVISIMFAVEIVIFMIVAQATTSCT